MSVSDDSNSVDSPKRKQNHRGKAEWKRLRAIYETSPISHRSLAKLEQISYSTLAQRAMHEKWRKPELIAGKLVTQAAQNLEAAANERAIAIVQDQLAPYIEKHKTKITKRAVKLSNRGLTRLESLWRKNKNPTEAKHEAESAKTLETLVRVARVSLGMGDGLPVAGAINLSLMVQNRGAMQVVANSQDSQG